MRHVGVPLIGERCATCTRNTTICTTTVQQYMLYKYKDCTYCPRKYFQFLNHARRRRRDEKTKNEGTKNERTKNEKKRLIVCACVLFIVVRGELKTLSSAYRATRSLAPLASLPSRRRAQAGPPPKVFSRVAVDRCLRPAQHVCFCTMCADVVQQERGG